MQVIECNECGETLGAADRKELVPVVEGHLRDEHGQEPRHDAVVELVASKSYEAMDS